MAAVFVAGGASAQPVPIGTAVGVEPAATAELGGTQVTLIEGADLYEGQTIVTDANGEVQMVFVDDTRMVLGPNSALVIERYLLRSPDTVEDLTVNILGGAFRFISGNSPSDSYTISTPTGDIVVRGTWFDGFVDWLTGIAEILVYQGSVYACPAEAQCIFIDVSCSIGILDENEAEVIREEGIRVSLANEHFPFARFEQGLLPDFRFGTAPDCLQDLTAEDVEAIIDEGPIDPPCDSDSCDPPCDSDSEPCEPPCESSDSCEEPPEIDPDYPCGNAPISCEDSSGGCDESGCCSESSPCCSDSSPCCASSPSVSCVIGLQAPAGTLPALYANDDLVGRRAA